MQTYTFSEIIQRLASSSRVKGIFTTGTTASQLHAASDIDVVVLLDENKEKIKSLYTTIEHRFADIFFFDLDFLHALQEKKEVSANSFDGMFCEWLTKGAIQYDPQNILASYKKHIQEKPPHMHLTELEKRDAWVKINYNYIANLRYYHSQDTLYHAALELRLLYSVIELITAYFSFRSIPWRGEKNAVAYFKKNDPEFFSLFKKYTSSITLDEKIGTYQELYIKTFFGEYTPWPDDFVIPTSQDHGYDPKITAWWKTLIT